MSRRTYTLRLEISSRGARLLVDGDPWPADARTSADARALAVSMFQDHDGDGEDGASSASAAAAFADRADVLTHLFIGKVCD